MTSPLTPLDSFKSNLTPYEHQRKTMMDSADAAYWAYFMEMGTGKSAIFAAQAVYAYTNKFIDTVLVMAKAGEYANWAVYLFPELLKEGIPHEILLYNSSDYSAGKLRQPLTSFMKVDRGRLRIVVANCEALNFRLADVLEDVYKTSRGVLIGADESTWCKTYDSKRSKAAYEWADKSAMRRIMSGTPVTQSPLDLWGQARFLGRGILGYKSIYSFRNDFIVMEKKFYGSRSFDAPVGVKNLGRLNDIINVWSTQVLKEDCLDLPAKVFKKQAVLMTPAQEKLYNQMRDEALIELEGHEVEVTNVLAQIVKLHQIACGQLKVGEDEYISIENNRIQALLDIVEDFPGKAIIWATYRQTLSDVYQALVHKFGEAAVAHYYGATKAEDRVKAVAEFQDLNSPLRFIVANPQSAGYGLTLTKGTLNVYYSNGYNLEHRLQSEDRTHRIGQTESVTYIDLVTPNTVDERIIEILRSKKNMAAEVMKTPLREWI